MVDTHIRIEGDDIATLRIDGQQVAEARVFQGVKEFNTNLTAGKKTVEIELFNQGEDVGTFSGGNPTVVGAIIDYNGHTRNGQSLNHGTIIPSESLQS